jgi:hypothetical protein
MAFVSQPFVQVTPTVGGITTRISGAANTVWSPINLSWNLGNGWLTSVGFTFYAPDGSQGPGPLGALAPAATNTGGIGAPFWTFEPSFAISYLADGWDLTAHLGYHVNTTNSATNFRSGDQLFLDLTATKRFGNWELGPVAYYSTQTTSDQDPNGTYAAANALGIAVYTKPEVFALGGLVGYDWSPARVYVYVTDEVFARDTAQGRKVWGNLIFKLWGEHAAPARLIHK